MILLADTSALGSVYLGDEVDAPWIGALLFDGPDPVVVCELADVELASLLARARDDGHIDDAGVVERLAAYAGHTADNGPIGVLPLTADVLALARQFVLRSSARTLDALHLAAAQLLADSSEDDVAVLTRDRRQAAAAGALGLAVHPGP